MLIFACQGGSTDSTHSNIPSNNVSSFLPRQFVRVNAYFCLSERGESTRSSRPCKFIISWEIDAHACFKPAKSSHKHKQQCKFWVIYATVNTYFCLSGAFKPSLLYTLHSPTCNFIVSWAVYALAYLFLLSRRVPTFISHMTSL